MVLVPFHMLEYNQLQPIRIQNMSYSRGETVQLQETPDTREWVMECANLCIVLNNVLDDLTSGTGWYEELAEERRAEQVNENIRLWLREVGSHMWPDMTHINIAGVMYPVEGYEAGDPLIMYTEDDIMTWCLVARQEPEAILELTLMGMTHERWVAAMYKED